MRKVLLFLFISCLTINISYGFKVDEPMGGISVGLGGVVLDRDMGGFNSIYNPSLIASSLSGKNNLDVSASYANAPYGISGIDNALFGITYAMDLGSIAVGAGIGSQLGMVVNGINEYRFYLGGGVYYDGINDMVGFIDGISGGLNVKVINYNTDVDLSMIPGFQNPTGVDLDLDLTLNMFKEKLSLGLMVSDLLGVQLSFFGNEPLTNSSVRSVILHAGISPIENVSIFGAINLTGTDHYVNRNNFLASSTALANTYFGVEASFLDSLYVRVGINEGRLAGGVGLIVEDLVINAGVMPISGLSMYYQVDVNYNFGSKSTNDEDEELEEIVEEEIEDEIIEEVEETETDIEQDVEAEIEVEEEVEADVEVEETVEVSEDVEEEEPNEAEIEKTVEESNENAENIEEELKDNLREDMDKLEEEENSDIEE